MRKILMLAIFTILTLGLINSVSAVHPSKMDSKTSIYVQVLPPLGYRYYVVPDAIPLDPRVIPAPVKPNFRTPIRDSLWYELYYLRLHRYNSIGRHLGIPPVYPGYPTKERE